MKNKASDNSSYNGIKIINNINFTVPKHHKLFNIISLIAVAFLGIYSTIFSFFSMFKINIGFGTVRFYTLLFFAAFTFIYMLPKKFHLVILPIMGIYVFLIYKKWNEFIIGFKLLFNQAYSSVYPKAGSYFNEKINNSEYIELFTAFMIFLLVALICSNILTKPNFLFGFIFTFPIIEIGLYFGKSPNIIYALMMIIFWLILLALSCCGYYQNFQKNKSGFIRRNNAFIAKPGIKFQTAGMLTAIMAAICVVIFAFTAVLSIITGYERPEKINTLRSDLKLAASEFSLDNFGESIEKFSATLGFGKNKFYSHKLGAVGNINFKNSTEITINTDDKFDDNIYLKGYTGTVYAGDQWTDFSTDIYDQNKEIFNELKRDRRYPQDMLTNYFLSRYAPSLVTMNITSDYQNEKYNYTPYISIPSGEVTYIDDTDTELADKNNYTFKVNKFQISLKTFTDILSGVNYSINDNYDSYTDFVYQNYCSVPDTEGLKEVYNRFVKDSSLDSDANIYQKLQDISNILSENAEYTLSPGKTPPTEDYVNYFLLKKHKGYCMHFATSGIILARMAGIPARYAEGYVLRASDFNNNNLNDDGTYTIEIKDSRAHAWAEVYFEHLGWVPYEFTPRSSAALSENNQKTTQTSQTSTKTTKSTISKQSKANLSQSSNSNSKNSTSVSISALQNTKKQSTSSLNLKFKVIMAVIVTIVIIFAVFVLRYIIKSKNRNDVLNNGIPKSRVTCAYLSAVKLIEFLGVERGNMQYIDFAEFAEKQLSDILVPGSFIETTIIMLKAQMSGSIPNDSEIDQTIKFYKELYTKILERNNIFKNIYMKYLKIL